MDDTDRFLEREHAIELAVEALGLEQWFRNYYECSNPNCEADWSDDWTAMCDDDCPKCGQRAITPYYSEEIDGENGNVLP